MPSPRTARPISRGSLATPSRSTTGFSAPSRIDQRFAPDLPLVRLDPEQIRRVIINLVDNAIEAMDRSGEIVVETQLDTANTIVRVIVADNGPGIPVGEREKLFLPYLRRRAAAADWVSPWYAASSPSTAAISTSATTRRAAHVLQSSCRAERRLEASGPWLQASPRPEPGA